MIQRKRLLTWTIVATVLASFLAAPSGYLLVLPGPVSSLSQAVTVEGAPASEGGSFYMVSVAAREIRVSRLILSWFDPGAALWSKRSVLAGRTLEEYEADNRALMEESQKTACYVAFQACGFAVTPGGPFPRPVAVVSGDVMGPSAGLAFALEILARVKGYDFQGLGKVAATGTLDPWGKVGPVGGVAQKALACRNEGIELFLVPASNEEEARRYAGHMKVVGVSSFQEALQALPEGLIP